MSDEFDGCECFFSHELAMRHLLSIIRQRQSYCTDTECIDLTNLPGQSTTTYNESGNFMLMSLFLIFAVILYMIRPNSMRRNVSDAQKPIVSIFNGIERDDDDSSPPSIG